MRDLSRSELIVYGAVAAALLVVGARWVLASGSQASSAPRRRLFDERRRQRLQGDQLVQRRIRLAAHAGIFVVVIFSSPQPDAGQHSRASARAGLRRQAPPNRCVRTPLYVPPSSGVTTDDGDRSAACASGWQALLEQQIEQQQVP